MSNFVKLTQLHGSNGSRVIWINMDLVVSIVDLEDRTVLMLEDGAEIAVDEPGQTVLKKTAEFRRAKKWKRQDRSQFESTKPSGC